MSRCFPYPPPGYEKIGNTHEALIESIKLQKGEKAKKERKEKKREKKEGEKKKRKIGETEKNKHGHKKRHKNEGSHDGKKGQEHQKMMRNEKEQFEKSSLTEEHGHPFGSQNLSDSSDSTLNSNRRQEHSSPSDGRHNPGSIIRIRFQRHKDQKVLPNKEVPCSALGSSDDFVQEMNKPARGPGVEGRDHIYPSTNSSQDVSVKLSKGEPCRSSEVLLQRAQSAPASRLDGSGSSSVLKFRDLIENWVPPLSQSECPNIDDDHEWLLSTKQDHNLGAKRFKTSGDGLSYECSTPWPRVCYLPEADIYALPFVFPF